MWSAWKNVEINMGEIEDDGYKAKVLGEAAAIHARAEAESVAVLAKLEERGI